ncbi:MAG: YfiR family protein [Ignavibacteria bacterium]|nr:YfiR family protein [Ignavibacteria bacterium]
MIGDTIRRSKNIFLAVVAVLISVAAYNPEDLQNKSYDEYSVKSVFLERFTRFIEWPASCGIDDHDKPFIICVLGKTSFSSALTDTYKQQKIRNKRVEIVVISSSSEIPNCHILFIPKASTSELPHAIRLIKDKPILIVSESEGGASKGTHINFFIENQKIGFEINNASFRQSGLQISSLLLKSARVVNNGGQK